MFAIAPRGNLHDDLMDSMCDTANLREGVQFLDVRAENCHRKCMMHIQNSRLCAAQLNSCNSFIQIFSASDCIWLQRKVYQKQIHSYNVK